MIRPHKMALCFIVRVKRNAEESRIYPETDRAKAHKCMITNNLVLLSFACLFAPFHSISPTQSENKFDSEMEKKKTHTRTQMLA